MKKVLYILLTVSLSLCFVGCGNDEPQIVDDTENNNSGGSNNNGNNNNGNGNNNNVKPPRIFISSSHTLNKNNGFVTGDIQLSIANRSEDKITSVKIVLKSDNQPSGTLGSWSEIKASHEKSTNRIDISNMKYPVAVCTYSYNGKSYSEEYSY